MRWNPMELTVDAASQPIWNRIIETVLATAT
jgi:hypothetical protein